MKNQRKTGEVSSLIKGLRQTGIFPDEDKEYQPKKKAQVKKSSGIGIKLINYANSQGILRLRKHPATETLRCFAFAFEGGKTNLLTNEEISKC